MSAFDDEYIENANWAMLIALESKHRMFGVEYVIEDGKITGVIKKNKIIKRGANENEVCSSK